MPRKRKRKYQVAVLDFETDPFKYGRIPEPFCVEFYTPDNVAVFWGDDCVEQLIEFLSEQEEQYLIYAHNGGKFDFHFLHKNIDNPALIIKNRIVEAKLLDHKIRDSFAILPFPLRDYDKLEFDYDKMERHCRERYKDEILEYLHYDCLKLYELVDAFVTRFGPMLTIGATAMKEIQKIHPFQKMGSKHDAAFRPFFYGGRVQCFKGGILPGPWKVYDVNSMYPSVMRNYQHPVNGSFDICQSIPDNFDKPFFAKVIGTNRNAMPSRNDNGTLIFNKKHGEFNICSHELKVALEYGLFDIHEVITCYAAQETINFKEWVDEFYNLKENCKRAGDKIGETQNKYVLNSGYGRFAINPENFEDWIIHRDFGNEEELEDEGYRQQVDYPDIELWSKKADISESQYCDVAIAASITSAARSVLLEGLQKSINPIYCDTDCIICDDFNGDIDPYRLGAWDFEKDAANIVIAGKKLYCLYNDEHIAINGPNPGKDPHFKLSSKGGTLTLNELRRIAAGETVNYENDAPTFSLKNPPTFISRNFRNTVDLGENEEYDEFV